MMRARLLGILLLALALLLAPREALAALDVTARPSAHEVEVGEPFTVELKAVSDQQTSMPSDPELRLPPEISVVGGPSISSQSIVQFGSGGSSVRAGIGATWQLMATAPGTYVIPPPSVEWEGRRVAAKPIQIKVVPATGRRKAQRPGFPFLLPGGPPMQIPWPFSQSPLHDIEDLAEDEPAVPELSLPKAQDPLIFLHARADKTSAVVGEQVTVSFYAYYLSRLGEPSMTNAHDAPMTDFLQVPLMKSRGVEPKRIATAGGDRYWVVLLDRVALFPLKAGDLHTGSMRARFAGRRIGAGVERASNDLVIRVTEPPLAGRPPGYQLGDVGRFQLSAAVQPRQIEQGGSVAVTVKISGTGNFPQSLRVPERTGIDWLDPEKRESIEARGGVIAGWRTLGYVVRIEQSGSVDLGAITLATWVPEEGRYAVERAALGAVAVTPVTPSAARPSGSAAPGDVEGRSDPFAALPGPRAALGAYAPPAPPPVEGGRFWALLAAPPLLVTLYGAGERLARRVRARRAAGASPAKLAAQAQREAAEAAARGDVKGAIAAAERAVHRAIEAATGLRSRGVLIASLPDELERKGMSRALAERARDVLSACAEIGFDPSADAAAAAELAERARDVTTELARWKPA